MRFRSIALLAAASAAVMTGATPASADFTTCTPTYSCTWEDKDYWTNGASTARLEFVGYIPFFSRWNYRNTSLNANNNASSMHNAGTSQTVYYFSYDRCNFAGTYFSRDHGQQDGDFSNSTPLPGGAFNDVASSGAFSGRLTDCYYST